MQRLDNGHLPIFDTTQYTRDMRDDTGSFKPDPQSRLDAPWGQLAYEYFTALPLEELTRRYDFDTLNATYLTKYPGYPNPGLAGLGSNTRIIDLPADAYQKVYAALFNYYPLVDPDEGAMTAKTSKIGPKVRGRINVNMAPWWVLDGLPVLPMGRVGTDGAIPRVADDAAGSRRPTSGVPLAEADWSLLDPPTYITGTAPHEPAAFIFMNGKTGGEMGIFDTPTAAYPPANVKSLPSVSPKLARYMTSYAQGQPVYNPAGTPIDAGHTVPGFVTPGNLCELMLAIPVTVKTLDTAGSSVSKTMTLGELRNELGQQVSGIETPRSFR